MSLHYLVKYECQKNGIILKYIIAINDESQGSIAKNLKCDELSFTLLVKEFVRLVNIWRSYRQNG